MTMSHETKQHLANTVKSLRKLLLEDLHSSTGSQYRFSIKLQESGLDEKDSVGRRRFQEWMNENVRGQNKDEFHRTAEDYRKEAEKAAAYTWLNRLVILRIMEASGLFAPKVLEGGWDSQGYKHFRALAPALVRGDESEGYKYLLELVFQDLATQLPGLFGPMGIADLVSMPTSTLKQVVELLDDAALRSCWDDDMTLGWIYQFWNDPEKEAIDEVLDADKSAKVEAHQIASKTQLFTERYMVDWLLQNSLNTMWLAICQKNGWSPCVLSSGTMGNLSDRRDEWRLKRNRGEVSLTDSMPLHNEIELRWAYRVPQVISQDLVDEAPYTVRDLKILDPAVGSGHFLIVAFDFLMDFYLEEAHHRGKSDDPDWSKSAIVESIIENNLHGIDIDPRAVQIAAAAVWLKGRKTSPSARPKKLNLVASRLRLSQLPPNDPSLVELRSVLANECDISHDLTNKIIAALSGADFMGCLLKFDFEIEKSIQKCEADINKIGQKNLSFPAARSERAVTLVERLEEFLTRHTSADDLGLRLRGEQLAAGVRFMRLLRDESYHIVVVNPPYLGTKKLAPTVSNLIKSQYSKCGNEVYAAVVLRALQLAKKGAIVAFVAPRTWMYTQQLEDFRKACAETGTLLAAADLHYGAFSEGKDSSVALAAVSPHCFTELDIKVVRPVPPNFIARDAQQVRRNEAGLLSFGELFTIKREDMLAVPFFPIVYTFDEVVLDAFRSLPLIEDACPVRYGAITGDDPRYVRFVWEVSGKRLCALRHDSTDEISLTSQWHPYVKGARGRLWIEGLDDVVNWRLNGLDMKVRNDHKYGSYSRLVQNEAYYFRPGVAFTSLGSSFGARLHRYRSIFSSMGCSLFPSEPLQVTVLLNSSLARFVAGALNPGLHFLVGDVNRLPVFDVSDSAKIFSVLNNAFEKHSIAREPSIEFQSPGPSPWSHAQEWAQTAADRPNGEPIPKYTEQLVSESPSDHLSYLFGIALGRFSPTGNGILDTNEHSSSTAFPHGICFLDGTLSTQDTRDSLGHSAAKILNVAWEGYEQHLADNADLRSWLRLRFFSDVHKGRYENRPIFWPLSSKKRTFVAWINIHRVTERTLRLLLADHLNPALLRLDGQLSDLRKAKNSTDKKELGEIEKQYDLFVKYQAELSDFIDKVTQCCEKGPPSPDNKGKKREVDSLYIPDLDDGVLINSAALWPILEPQWKEPKEWWIELSEAKDKNDYDWSHLSMKYWPNRVDSKCKEDPSLAVAHGCFWRYHPALAWAWELRLQEEIHESQLIIEPSYRGDGGDSEHRAIFLQRNPKDALAIVQKEIRRRQGRGKSAKQIPDLKLNVVGIWSSLPSECWFLEDELMQRQNAPFRLIAPDEEEYRIRFEHQNPDKVKARKLLLDSFKGQDKRLSEIVK